MKFEIGDIVICTGWDNIDTDTNYDGMNVLEYYGVDRYDTFEVKNLHPNYLDSGDDLISFNTGQNRDFGLSERYFKLLSEYREEELNKML